MNKYWKSLDELNGKKYQKKLTKRVSEKEASKIVSTRRDFLKLMGVGIGSATLLNGCQKPIQKAIPHLVQPEEIIPGTPNYFATSYFSDNKFCSVIAKVRDGRPIKIEGNTDSPLSKGGTTAQIQASVLGLYDQVRYKKPEHEGEVVSWDELNTVVKTTLAQESKKKIALLTQTIISPTTQKLLQELTSQYSQINWIQYDAVSSSGILLANEIDFGQQTIPLYHFDRADVVVAIEADFLGTWLSPALFSSMYSKMHNPFLGRMIRHYHFESGMTISGGNSDYRFPIEAGEERTVLVSIHNELARRTGQKEIEYNEIISNPTIQKVVSDLMQSVGRSLIVCGSQFVVDQQICNRINMLLGNLGSTIDFTHAMQLKKGVDANLESFVTDLKAGEYGGVIFCDVNPVYDSPYGSDLSTEIKKLPFSVAFAESPNETTELCKTICPLPHFLERWDDAMPYTDFYAVTQPVIRNLFDTRSYQSTFLSWMGKTDQSWREVIRKNWEKTIYTRNSEFKNFNEFWEETMKNGYYLKKRSFYENPSYTTEELKITSTYPTSKEGYHLKFYESIALGSGRYANNPILMELPDPISRVSWDNFASISVDLAKDLEVEDEDVILLNGIKLPVFIQPGQARNTISIAIGYGRSICGKIGNGVGVNVYPQQTIKEHQRHMFVMNAKVEKGDEKYELAMSQTHNEMEGRPIVRETTLLNYKKKPSSGNEFHAYAEKHKVSLYDVPKNPGHHWGMAIDLTKCVGCNNCAVSCQIENNVPVIGKEQVRNRRIMHWMRIDRYYSGSVDNPSVVFQPVMCQHCDNAPCENVCPVAATVHSNEGINQMAYNRCVGTRYCLNNCPYRVRRFNWFQFVQNDKFDFSSNNDLGRMVLNPDVTVRSRGVIEKCSFCVQRIQEKKLLAKKEGRSLRDGEISPACAQSCPSKAIVFGDLNDPNSQVAKLYKDPRNYHLLEELHTLPSVGYLTKVRNYEEA